MIWIAAAAVLVGAALQSATGFGFALVAAPIMFALLGPQEAVSAGVLLGIELNLLTLLTERRRPSVLGAEARALVAWSLPGLALGAIALRELPGELLSALVGLSVLAAIALRLRTRTRTRAGREPEAPRARPVLAAAAGASSGALSTATSLGGPPLALYLLARGASAAQMRDTLAAIFVALAVLSAPALLLTGTFHLPQAVWVLLLAGVAGQILGRRGFARLVGDRYEKAVLAVLGVTALLALASSVA